MARVDINGTQLEYFEAGKGAIVVLVHGSASDYRTWYRQLKVFVDRYRVVTYSRRYHWPNDPIAEGKEYKMDEQLDDLDALLQSLDAEKMHLVGHSYGAFLGLLLAMRRPQMIQSLVLAEPPVLTLFVSNQPKPGEIIKLLLTKVGLAMAIMRFGAKGVAPTVRAFKNGDDENGMRIFGDAVFGHGSYDKLPEERKQRILDNLGNVKAELLGPGFLPLDKERIRQVKIPTLLVRGWNTIPLFGNMLDYLDALLPQTEHAAIPRATHAPHEDNADAFNKAVLEFLGKHSG